MGLGASGDDRRVFRHAKQLAKIGETNGKLALQNENQCSGCSFQAGLPRRFHSSRSVMADQADIGVLDRQSSELFPGSIGAAVIDDHDFRIFDSKFKKLLDGVDQTSGHLMLAISHGNHDRNRLG